MGWVTLALRKKELQRTHSELQVQDLKISREERQMARQYGYEQTVVQNDQQNALSDLRSQYRDSKNSLFDEIQETRHELNDANGNENADESYKKERQEKIDQLNQNIRDAQEEYEYQMNQTKEMYESDLEMIEEEASEVEAAYENEKVMIETQMEAVAQELQAVTEATSQEIKNSTIKLS